jgi:hypothetical protein
MSDELSVVEKVAEEVLIDLMTERVISERRMSAGVQASSKGGVQASPSIACRAGLSQNHDRDKNKAQRQYCKHQADPTHFVSLHTTLSDKINHDSVPRDF